ncbi:hypothetical protein PEC106568_06910 [Pectobacterium carotovorum subsp. carotovorum]|nr:hypothetical protein DMB41_16075 [Pectobacterium carotovorum subsp. carotovorum]GKV75517.1 hypothetical protein PEC106568_06910 [Pectobacterium carotovorum subsp. carotovorum]
MSIWNFIVLAIILGFVYFFVFIPCKFSYKKLSEKGWSISQGATGVILVYLLLIYLLFVISQSLGFIGDENVYGIIVVLIINAISWFIINILINFIPNKQEKKKCKYCGEMVLKEAVKCKHCGSDLL